MDLTGKTINELQELQSFKFEAQRAISSELEKVNSELEQLHNEIMSRYAITDS